MTCRTEAVSVADRLIGPGYPPFIIAEMSANHNGSLARAMELMDAAKEAGVDAVKLQTLRPDMITIDFDGPEFRVNGGLWDGARLYDLYRQAQTPWEWHKPLFDKGRQLGLTVFSSPFDRAAVDFLAELDAPAYKIASFEMADTGLVRHAAGKRRPMIISTGMAGLGEIALAVETARDGGADGLVLLHCVSAYPSRPEDANLRTIPHMSQAFAVPVGLSDHTHGIAVSVAAVALGACVIEKHFTLRRSDGGVDSEFSLEPHEMKALVEECRTAWQSVGEVSYGVEQGEMASLAFRRSLYVVADVRAGEILTEDNVRSIRPGYGLAPRFLDEILGRRARRDLARGTPFAWSMVE